MSYFLNTPFNIEGNNKLRTPQIEAYLKIRDFFKNDQNKEALVVLPTGTGKSGLISIAPYGISLGRVLIVTPGIVTKDSIRKTQDALHDNFWINYDVVINHKHLPITTEYSADLLRQHLDSSNFIYTNIHQLSQTRESSLVRQVPRDYFDLIIIDEAHHAPATSWKQLLEYFGSAKKLYVTGTPFRGDGVTIPGQLIHETKLSEVMRDRYVKWLRKETVNSSELYFTMPAFPGRRFTKDEVLAHKDNEWLEKSVALSEACSRDVINHSLASLDNLKKQSNKLPHKVLAVGCSILHAEDLKSWYIESGMRVALIHSQMDEEIKEQEFKKIEAHEVDVVVSVNMLMEGYDHKYLTILALFRPYRSPNAFAQVVGRVLRVIPEKEGAIFETDNNALIVYHEETGLNEMWAAFQTEVDRAKQKIRRDYDDLDHEYSLRDNSLAGVETSASYIATQDSYLPDIDFNEIFQQKRREIEEAANTRLQILRESGITDHETLEKLRSVLVDSQTKEVSEHIDPDLIEKRPAQARKRLREILKKRIEDEAASLLTDKNLDLKGTELASGFKRILPRLTDGQPNDAVLVIFINSKLYSRFGKRDGLDNKALINSLNYIPEIIKELGSML
ncbi:DEAD/DEAH box helicase [Pseudomonas monteilii]|uniref:DEAD/DEAH box helicase n=1 Tax=Pseudomonas monteilii TaxID=76759 RepID=UPI0018D8159A|nr:DEAD/DEAH box helicase family protein [Pseudomonas monteilii]MBH3395833.1 DEAD/DEAH box helicase family protein [Pseudomonas monteilii]